MGEERKRSWEQAMQMDSRVMPSFQSQGPVPNEARSRSVPLWEKNFCTQMCMIPWEKICVAQKRLASFVKIANWDNSAGEEAFLNAKARYWATINGLPCHIPLPDPDAYIDVVDHDAVIDDQDDSFLFSADQPVPAAVDFHGNASFYSGQEEKKNWKLPCRR